MKRIVSNKAQNIMQRSRETLMGITQKKKLAFMASFSSEDVDVPLDAGAQRFAQTLLGHILLRWARPAKKPKKKRRFPIFTVICLVLFALMMVLSLLNRNSASAAPIEHTHTQSAAQKISAQRIASANGNPLKCEDGSDVDANGLCAPSTFNPDKCAADGNKLNAASTDPCNPWAVNSNQYDPAKASVWEPLRLVDQECIFKAVPPNSDIKLRDVIVQGQINKNGMTLTHECKDANSGQTFPCTEEESVVAFDWLSGDYPSTTAVPKGASTNPAYNSPGHLQTTYTSDTTEQPNLVKLYPYTMAVGFLLLGPSIILAGYQIMMSASSFRYAEALTILSRVMMAGVAVAVCFNLVQLMIDFSNTLSTAVVGLHTNAVPYPDPEKISNSDGTVNYYIGYVLVVAAPATADDPNNLNQSLTDGTVVANDPDSSYRGIVVPINRWGCAANDFLGIITKSFWTNVFSSFIPFFGQLAAMVEKINTAIAVVHHLGSFTETILSIGLFAQIVFRIIMLNFYILMGPLACGCWGLPGGVGQKVISQWFKGFCSLLFVQAVQLFILTSAPLIIPDLAQMNLPTDDMGLLKSLFAQLPAIIVLFVTLQVPKIMGTSAAKSLSSAGTLAGGTVAAAGAAAYSLAG